MSTYCSDPDLTLDSFYGFYDVRCVRDFPSGPCGRPTGGPLFCSTCSPKPTDSGVE